MKTQSSWLALLASLLLWTPATVAEEQSLSLLLLPPIAGEGSAQLAISWQGHAHGQLELLVTDVDGQTRSIKTREVAPGMHLEPLTTGGRDERLLAVVRDAAGRELARAEHALAFDAAPASRQSASDSPVHAETTPVAAAIGAKGALIDWKATFGGNNGPDREVRAMTVYDDGTGPALVIGGQFLTAGGLVVNGLARWNGTSWSGFGSDGGLGVDGRVDSLLAVGSELYVGGGFRRVNVGGPAVDANCVARWNGRQWSNLGNKGGNGVNGSFGCAVSTLAMRGGDLYVGGIFDRANIGGAEVLANAIARWSPATSAWSSIGAAVPGGGMGNPSGSPAWVSALAFLGGDLYAGGNFRLADGITASFVARWNGEQWHPLPNGSTGEGTSSSVGALLPFGGELYVGTIGSVIRWNPATSAFSSVGGDFTAFGGLAIRSLIAVGPDIYVAGRFDRVIAGGTQLSLGNIARWTPSTSTWSSLGDRTGVGRADGNQGEVFALAAFNGQLYVGGGFVRAFANGTGIDTQNAARWNTGSNTWSALGSAHGASHPPFSILGNVTAVATYGDALYVGGEFTQVTHDGQSIAANYIARWDGDGWSRVGSAGGNGVGGTVRALEVMGGELYVGGFFSEVNVGGAVVPARGIARWNGSSWSGVGSAGGNGVGGAVRDLLASGSDLYVAGSFGAANAGGPEVTANGIARWNGSRWSALGSNGGSGTSGGAYSLALWGGDLYVGGFFERVNVGGPEVAVNNIARWNGSVWSSVGGGGGTGLGHPGGWTRAGVFSLAVFGNELYAGGQFTRANEGGATVPVNRIARWDRTRWASVGSGGGNGVFFDEFTDAGVNDLLVHGGQLYVGGLFQQANSGGLVVPASHIARWDGNTWSSVGSGVGGRAPGSLTLDWASAISSFGGDLVVAGRFGRAGSVASGNVALFGTTDATTVTIASTTPALSAPGEMVEIRVRLTASAAPTAGHVTITGLPGGSCSDLTLTPVSATSSEATCTIRWIRAGEVALTARYTGGTRAGSTWSHAVSAPFPHTVAALFDDGFEAQSP